MNIDQGAVFGGSLTAYRYPEGEFVSVKAKRDYAGDPDSPLIRWERGDSHRLTCVNSWEATQSRLTFMVK